MHIIEQNARLSSLKTWQDDESGQPKHLAKLDYFGGSINVMISPAAYAAFRVLEGKMVSAMLPCAIVRIKDANVVKFDGDPTLTETKTK